MFLTLKSLLTARSMYVRVDIALLTIILDFCIICVLRVQKDNFFTRVIVE